ncbi:MAG TPA: hypothetical protein VIV15_02425, partial [Anaerolineales bacterium]
MPLLLGWMTISPSQNDVGCDADNGGLVLPKGACATVVASDVGGVRQLTVASNGDLYAARASGPNGVLAL